MSLLLSKSLPPGTEAKTHHACTGIGICLGKYEITFEDFCEFLIKMIKDAGVQHTMKHSDPELIVCSHHDSGVFIGDIGIPGADFRSLVYYVMTNTNLECDDPRSVAWAEAKAQLKRPVDGPDCRMKLLYDLGRLKIVEGYEPNTKRLGLPQEKQ